jgi:hypothetical protein
MAALLLLDASAVFAAVGCTLTDPDRDIRRLFPKASNYKTEFLSIEEHGGEALRAEIEKKLGDKLDTVYETDDVPYAYYTVLQGKTVIGYVHGVNQKGRFGGMQLITATDINGKILDFYYQKLTSPEAKAFRSKKFTQQFVGLTLKEFYTIDISQKIADPSKDNARDYKATLRGLKKNLILCDIFKLNRKYDPDFKKQSESKETEGQSS